jgi:hypothetical protein
VNPDWSLVRLGQDKPQSFTKVRSLTQEEWEGYKSRCEFLRGLVSARMPFRNMLHAHAEFLRHVSVLEANPAALAERRLDEWGAPLNHRLDALLIAMRGYLAQAEFRFSRAGAEGAKALALLVTSRTARHARSAAYRIAYAMRDYVQHARPALTGSRVVGSLDPVTNTSQYTFTLACDRDDLLRHGFKWKRARADLEALPATFDPRPILEEAIGELAELDRELFDLNVDRIMEAKGVIEALLAQADSSGDPSRGTVGKIEDVGRHPVLGARQFSMTFHEPPAEFGWP